MTTENHSIEPLPSRELVTSWRKEVPDWIEAGSVHLHIASRAAQWGYAQRGAVNEAELQKARDEELEACCEWIGSEGLAGYTSRELRAARRPKPKSQAEKALEALEQTVILLMPVTGHKKVERLGVIRAALERLRKLEDAND